MERRRGALHGGPGRPGAAFWGDVLAARNLSLPPAGFLRFDCPHAPGPLRAGQEEKGMTQGCKYLNTRAAAAHLGRKRLA